MDTARVAVVGGGRMGRGIAHAFLLQGFRVLLLDVTDEALHSAQLAIRESLVQSMERISGINDDEALVRLALSTTLTDIADCSLVIEAVPEDFELKEHVLSRIDEAISSTALLATNTSSFSVQDLANSRKYRNNFLGLHFFNPVPSSLMVEIVSTSHNSPEIIDIASDWVSLIGKTPLRIADSPGFATSRLGVILGLEAMRMLEEGVATAGDIDAAMMLGYKHPIGPLKLTDIVGLDVRLGISQYLETHFGARFKPPKILVDLVAEGNLGRKSGKGFYEWGGEAK